MTHFNAFVESLSEKAHKLGTDDIYVQFLNSAPSATNSVETDLPADLSTGGGYTSGGIAFSTVISSSQTDGLYDLKYNNFTFTATAVVGPFRYVVFFNNSSANKDLICWYDNTTAVTLGSGGVLNINPPGHILIEIEQA